MPFPVSSTGQALRKVVIPELHETIRFIYDKLAEAERDNISRLMKITDIIRAWSRNVNRETYFMACGSSILSVLLFHLNEQPQEKCLYVKRVRSLRTPHRTKFTSRYEIYSANNTAYLKRISSIPAQKPNTERDNISRLMKITDIDRA